MPRERTELTRLPKAFRNQGKIFVLAYEGNHTEPQYYEALKETLKHKEFTLHIESLKRSKNDTNSAPKHVFKALKEKQREFNFRKSDEFWMIIDKDDWKHDEWVKKCESESNFHIALSNPTFELWLLLHVVDVSKLSKEIIDEIEKNRKISRKKRYLERFLAEKLNGYSKTKVPTDQILPYLENAIDQAEKLDVGDIRTNMGSHNYKLVKKFLVD
mgnify:CR=1 FL=1